MSNAKGKSSKTSTHYDVAIVGGGVSGVYSGWRLLTANAAESPQLKKLAGKKGKLKVAVFEGTNRIGGRLLSARPPGFPDSTNCEIGGMRYVSSQTLVRSLVENELKLPRYEQVVDQPGNIMYLRGQQLRFSQNQDPAAMPYLLDWAEEEYILHNDPSGLIGWGISKIIPQVNSLDPDDLEKFLRTAMVDGTPLYQHGFWNLLSRALSPDAYQVARALVGYDCLGSNANAVDLITEYFNFTPDARYYMFSEGYDTVPWELEKRFTNAGGEVIQSEWVSGFESTTLSDGSTGVELHFRGKHESVTASAIILAMPRRSLELLDRVGPVFGAQHAEHVHHLVGSVRAIPLYKLFLAYEYPWWQGVGVKQGRSLTDTPVRQLYYWPIDPTAAAPAATGRALLMAYNDATNVDFWEGLSGAETPVTKTRGAAEHFRKLPPGVRMFESMPLVNLEPPAKNEYDRRLRDNWNNHHAPYEMVMEMHRQIKHMHDIQYAPHPVDAAYMDWSVDPYGGGVHLWNRGYKSWEVLHDITQPVSDFPCYICGEAYSTNQTWVEGALQTAEIVLQKHLGLKKPKWITPNPKPPAPQPPKGKIKLSWADLSSKGEAEAEVKK
jgi:monoamine oxidase